MVPQPVPRAVRPRARGDGRGRGRGAARARAGADRPPRPCSTCWPEASRAAARAPIPQTGDPSLRLLRRVGVVDPASLDDYRAHGGYAALRRAVELGPEGVLREVKDSKLLGRGGAAFPTGVKWEAVARQPARPHYLVCNADESEPGTFKDRVLMEGDPFAVIEAMTIAAYATGCEHGYVYLRGEYPEALHALEHALDEARRRGFLGDDVMGEGFSFDVEIRKGAGAYICGEETAIFESIEGNRGEPRNKPPFPVEVGLFGKPTVVNNVETLVNVLDVVLGSGPVVRRDGHRGLDGNEALLPLRARRAAGDVRGAVRHDAPRAARARGRRAGRQGAPGGPDGRRGRQLPRAGRARPAAHLRGRARGRDDARLRCRARARRDGRPARASSCASPRSSATSRAVSASRVASARCASRRRSRASSPASRAAVVERELALIGEVGQCMRDASICGLGQTASSAIESAIGRLRVFQGQSA